MEFPVGIFNTPNFFFQVPVPIPVHQHPAAYLICHFVFTLLVGPLERKQPTSTLRQQQQQQQE